MIRDYNGHGPWSVEAVRERHQTYAREFGTAAPLRVAPTHTKGDITWIYPIMDVVIAGIERGDKACNAIGIEFVDENQRLPFGHTLKSKTARALRRAELTAPQVDRLREQIVGMLLAGTAPHVYREYAKLFRRIGLGEWWSVIEREVPRDNPRAMRYYDYFSKHATTEPTS